MFGDLFESFQDIVAQAKKERDQLDRLLTISTPRERLLVAASAFVLLAMLAWLFFGGITRSVTLDGVLVESAGIPAGDGVAVQALVWLEKDIAQQIEAGMAASIVLAPAAGEELRLTGEVASLNTETASGPAELVEFEAPAAVHNVQIMLREDPGLTGLDVAECRIVIELGNFPPITLMGIGTS